nr:MAG TPA: hypothetical protein [Microviridae sp.]
MRGSAHEKHRRPTLGPVGDSFHSLFSVFLSSVFLTANASAICIPLVLYMKTDTKAFFAISNFSFHVKHC